MEFNLANIENNVMAMPNYENGKQIIVLFVKKGSEHFATEFRLMYLETFNYSLQIFETSSWNTKSGFYTILKFKEKI